MIALKIKELADKRGATNADVARAAGVSRSAVTKWFNGTSQPKADVLPALAEFFCVPIDAFYEDEEINHYISESFRKQGQIFDVAAGNGAKNGTYATEYMDTDTNDDYARICGDSMYPILHDGDVVKVIPATRTLPSDLSIVKINGDESTCKYVEVTSDGVWLRAENKDVFKDKFYSVQECLTLPVQIIGKAVEIVSRKL